MTAPATETFPYRANALLFLGALAAALFFNGPQMELLVLATMLLTAWGARVVLAGYSAGFEIPKSFVALFVMLFWLWLGFSVLFSPAPAVSRANFWWVGSLPMVFWFYTLSVERRELWRQVAPMLLLVGVVLALVSIYQALVFDEAAHSVFITRNSHAAFTNLIVLPACAYFLMRWPRPGARSAPALLLGAAVFILLLSVFVTAGRGAVLSLAIAFGMLLAIVACGVPRRAVLVLVGLAIAAFVFAQFAHGELGGRLEKLTQDTPRWMIWESSWRMLRDAPWHGIGLGLYYLLYPRYRNVEDSTGGYFAHNDYLQFWIETGPPGSLLLIGAELAVALLMARALARWPKDDARRIEATGLFAGLLAVAGHSIVDFNFYILAITLASGFALGRWHELAHAACGDACWKVPPTRWLRWHVYVPAAVALFAGVFIHLGALGISNSLFAKAVERARAGDIVSASESLARAAILSPADERIPATHADLLRHVLGQTLHEDIARRRVLYEDAQRYLDEAIAANPLRVLPHTIRARLLVEQPQLAGADSERRALDAYAHALERDPLHFMARTECAEILLTLGHRQEAREILEAGMAYRYPERAETLRYYRLTQRLRQEAGDREGADRLEPEIQSLQQVERSRYQAGP